MPFGEVREATLRKGKSECLAKLYRDLESRRLTPDDALAQLLVKRYITSQACECLKLLSEGYTERAAGLIADCSFPEVFRMGVDHQTVYNYKSRLVKATREAVKRETGEDPGTDKVYELYHFRRGPSIRGRGWETVVV